MPPAFHAVTSLFLSDFSLLRVGYFVLVGSTPLTAGRAASAYDFESPFVAGPSMPFAPPFIFVALSWTTADAVSLLFCRLELGK